ncbi:MAG: C39 family peptidase [Candidatus Methanoperedens sp.]|nr:C39 family peptidase [Candidatus Methanoperedens sp.]
MKRQIITNDSRKVQILRVPYYYQSESDWLCFVFSLKMCLDYFKNIYQSDFIRSNTPNKSVDELRHLTHTGQFMGTRVDDSLVNELSREIPSIKFSLDEKCSINTLLDNFNRNLPTIVLYNCSYMLYEEEGPGHAGVIIGILDDNDLILHNPWLGPEVLVKWKDFQKGWELEYNKVVIMKPETQTKLEV